MPMDFPDLDSLKQHAEIYQFRQPSEGETELQYRLALADHVEPLDFVESCEIRNKVGWDKFTPMQKTDMLKRKMGAGNLFEAHMELGE